MDPCVRESSNFEQVLQDAVVVVDEVAWQRWLKNLYCMRDTPSGSFMWTMMNETSSIIHCTVDCSEYIYIYIEIVYLLHLGDVHCKTVFGFA